MPLRVNWSPLHDVQKRFIYTALSCDFCDPTQTHPMRPEWKAFEEVSKLSDQDRLVFEGPEKVDGRNILDILRKLDIVSTKWNFGAASIVSADYMSVLLYYPAICFDCDHQYDSRT